MMQVLQVGYSLENKVVFPKPGMCAPDFFESFLSASTENVFLFQNVLCWRSFESALLQNVSTLLVNVIYCGD